MTSSCGRNIVSEARIIREEKEGGREGGKKEEREGEREGGKERRRREKASKHPGL